MFLRNNKQAAARALRHATPTGQPMLPSDPGMGGRVAATGGVRLINPDGTFNIRRTGLPWYRSLHFYHFLMSSSWPRLFLLIILSYLFSNVVFGLAYTLCGVGGLVGGGGITFAERWLEAIFFSIQTVSTIGYGALHPATLATNIIVGIEALYGLCLFAFIAGLIFARFSRPLASIATSAHMVIAPYRGGRGLMFRTVNTRARELYDVHAIVIYSRVDPPVSAEAVPTRGYDTLRLERSQVTFFPLAWTVVHPIDAESPLFGLTAQELHARSAEFIVMITGTEETFNEGVHQRTSYRAEQVREGFRFTDMSVVVPSAGLTADEARLLAPWRAATIDVRKLSDIAPAPLPPLDQPAEK